MALRIHKQVLRFDVAMAVSEGMNVCKSPETLISVHLDKQARNWLLHFIVMFEYSVHCLWDIVHDNVQIDLILLFTENTHQR